MNRTDQAQRTDLGMVWEVGIHERAVSSDAVIEMNELRHHANTPNVRTRVCGAGRLLAVHKQNLKHCPLPSDMQFFQSWSCTSPTGKRGPRPRQCWEA